ncbi:MAG: metalloprotease TldD [Alphaproteobacteria bacterium]
MNENLLTANSLASAFQIDYAKASNLIADAFKSSDDGELYLKYGEGETLTLDDNTIKNASYNVCQGYGLRVVSGDVVSFAHSNKLGEQALVRLAGSLKSASLSGTGVMAPNPEINTRELLYKPINPIVSPSFDDKIKLLQKINDYARSLDTKIFQVTASLTASYAAVAVVKPDGFVGFDYRPITRIGISVMVKDGNRIEAGNKGAGGRFEFARILQDDSWQAMAREAFRKASLNLEAKPAPAGEMAVVLGSGWPGVLLHEAVGHGLEGDFNRKKSSVYSGKIGERVAAKGVTIIDDGTIPERRGSLNIDDEGTPTKENVLIEDGILKGYMFDRMNSRLMGCSSTGNGRRESYDCMPMPRMTNTFMAKGDCAPDEIISSVKKGIYAVDFTGGQVDIVSGKFVFSCSEAYEIENGKIGSPIKGATLIGNGFDVMNKINMIGNDLELDGGIGVCGKAGQSVPVGIGQPTLKIDSITVGGTKTE